MKNIGSNEMMDTCGFPSCANKPEPWKTRSRYRIKKDVLLEKLDGRSVNLKKIFTSANIQYRSRFDLLDGKDALMTLNDANKLLTSLMFKGITFKLEELFEKVVK
jgi:predicted transcriptional regulator